MPSAEAAAELRAAIDILKTHHMNRDKLDWPVVEAKAFTDAANAKSAADTYPVIQSIIRQFGEKHSSLITAAQWKTMMAAPQSGAPLPPPLILMPFGMLLANNIGYLNLTPFNSGIDGQRLYVAQLRGELKRFQAAHVCRVIVDLRYNTGGNMLPMLNGIISLLGSPPYGYWLSGDDNKTAWKIEDFPFVFSQIPAFDVLHSSVDYDHMPN